MKYNFKEMNTKKQGDVGLGAAIGYFTTLGYTVCVPLTDSQDYDLVVEFTDGLKRIQVKTTSFKNPSGNYRFSTTTKGGNQSWNKVYKNISADTSDYVFILTESGDEYLISTKFVEQNKSTFVLSNKWESYKL